MSRNEKFEDEEQSKPASRRNSASFSRRSSIKREKEKKSLSSAPSSTQSTPKKIAPKPQNLDFMVTGRQILKRSDRANSLPGYRRSSSESITKKRPVRPETASSKSRETSQEDDMTLDLSQVSDFEDTNSMYGTPHKFLATSTPKSQTQTQTKSQPKTQPRNFQKSRSASLQSQMYSQKLENCKRNLKECQKRDSTLSYSRDSFKTSSSVSRYTTELDYSSVSPGCSTQSGQSSADLSPRVSLLTKESPRSHEYVSSCCISSWQDCSEGNTQVEDIRTDGEWSNFWANYNNSLAKVPMKCYHDQCPTPYRTENIDLADLDISVCGNRSPDAKNINTIIRNEGLNLTPRETQNLIKCAHILGNVLTKAIDRRSKEKDIDEKSLEVTKEFKQEIFENINSPEKAVSEIDPVIEIKKKTLTLNLKETNIPAEVKEEKRCEVTTQTDISLPNTKSAPRIFEKILRQLSRTSLDVPDNVENSSNKEEDTIVQVKKDG